MKGKYTACLLIIMLLFSNLLPVQIIAQELPVEKENEIIVEDEGNQDDTEESIIEEPPVVDEENKIEEEPVVDEKTKEISPKVEVEELDEDIEENMRVSEDSLQVKEISEPNIILDDFENGMGNWDVVGVKANSVGLDISSEYSRFGSSSLKMDYDFSNQAGTSGAYASLTEPIEIPGHPKKLSMWVYGDGEKHWLRQQLYDATGERFNIDFTSSYPSGVTWKGWKYVEATIPANWKPPFKIKDQAIRYMATNEEAKGVGTLYFDDLRAIYEDVEEDTTNPEITSLTPSDEQLVYSNQPEIAVIATDDHSGMDLSRTQMTLDGKKVEPKINKDGIITYIPERPLSEGLHTVYVEVFDKVGNHKFVTWTFTVEADGPAINWEADEEVYAGSQFDVKLKVKNIKHLKGTELVIDYDAKLLEVVDANPNIEGLQVNIPQHLQEAITVNKVDTEKGEIHLHLDELNKLDLDDDEYLAILTFKLGLDASGSFTLKARDGQYVYANEVDEVVPFFLAPFKVRIAQPLLLEVKGKSEGTPTELRVIDKEKQPVEGASISILNNQKLIEVTEPTHIYKGGSGIAGDPFEALEVGEILPVAKDPYSGFDFYRIFMPDGNQRYFHVPKDAVKEVDWGKRLGKTNAKGIIETDELTISRIPLKLQAVKGDLVSQVESFTVSRQLGKEKPEHIFLTWTKDPKTTQHFSWKTNTFIKDSVVEVYEADNDNNPTTFTGSSELFGDETGEMNVHKVEVTGLKPGTTYKYRVGDGTEAGFSEMNTFTTESAEEEAFRFMFFADTQAYDEKGFKLFTDLINLGLEKYPETKFSVHAGDIVEEGNRLAQWEDFLDASDGAVDKLPLMMVLGNHDVYGDGANTFKSLFTYPQNGPKGKENFVYSFDYGNARFLMLNSEFGVQDMEEQQEWIREEVKAAGNKWTIVTFHRSPYKSNPKRGKDATATIFAPLLEELDVDLVLTGHDHAYMRSHPIKDGKPQIDGEGTLYMIGGSAGPKFYPGIKEEYVDVLYDDKKQVFTSLLVDKNEIKIEAYTKDDELIDEFTLEKRKKATVDKSELEVLIDKIKEQELSEEKYTKDSYQVLKEALLNAETVLTNETADLEMVEEAILALEAGYENLELREMPGTDPEDGGTDPEDGGTDPEDGGTDPEDGGTDPEDGGTDPEDGGTDPEDGGTDPEDGGTDPEDGGTDPEDGGTDPEDGGTDPEDGGTDPEDGGTDPEDGGTDPEDGGTDPEDGGTDPEDEGTDPEDEGTDPEDGGTDLEDGSIDSGDKDRLPATSTSIFNQLLLGFVLLIIAVTIIIARRYKER